MNITSFEEKEHRALLEMNARTMAVIFQELPEGLNVCISKEGSVEIR